LEVKQQEDSAYCAFAVAQPSEEGINRRLYEDFEDIHRQQHSPYGSTVAFLQKHKDLLIEMARMIATGAGRTHWESVDRGVLPQLRRAGWTLEAGVRLMRSGVRDLALVGASVDYNSKCVLEAILRKVDAIEAAFKEDVDDGNDNQSDPFPKLVRAGSVGASIKHDLSLLRDKLQASDFKRLIKFFILNVKNILRDQSNLLFRTIRKDHQVVEALIKTSVEALDLLKHIGFLDKGAIFTIERVDRDRVMRAYDVLKEAASTVGIEIL